MDECVSTYVLTCMNIIMFEWYMTRFVVKNGHEKDRCYDKSPKIHVLVGIHRSFKSKM